MLNRAVARLTLFEKPEDYEAFERVLDEALQCYVERNPLHAGLVEKAEDWKYGSLWRQVNGTSDDRRLLADWPIERSRPWRAYVNRPQHDTELAAIRHSVRKGSPYSDEAWVA
jgi:putative transposase